MNNNQLQGEQSVHQWLQKYTDSAAWSYFVYYNNICIFAYSAYTPARPIMSEWYYARQKKEKNIQRIYSE